MDQNQALDRRNRIFLDATRAQMAFEYITEIISTKRVNLLEKLYMATNSSDLKTELMASIAGGLTALDDLERHVVDDIKKARQEEKKTHVRQ